MKFKTTIKYFFMLFLLTQIGCKKYLDQKPDLTMVVPKTIADCQALLDNYNTMNSNYSDHGETASDDYYLTDETWKSFPINSENSDNYIWATRAEHESSWLNAYIVVYNANLVLQVLEKINPNVPNYDTIKGSALFFRSFAFYNTAQLFCDPYSQSTLSNSGIPLRLSPDLTAKTTRSTVKATYEQIINDLKLAINLLPLSSSISSRPNKRAALAMLARVYLTMEDYQNAGKMAEECLKLNSTLIDYKDLTYNSSGPSFLRFNNEVIFQSTTVPGLINDFVAIVHPDLIGMYQNSDLRKQLFFSNVDPNTGEEREEFTFRGNYDGTTMGALFNGLAIDEIYLIRAECFAREGNVDDAMKYLNQLLRKRHDTTFSDLKTADATIALLLVLNERRKELAFRTLRWSDLRRLNLDDRFKTTLRRTKNTIPYSPLAPNDLRYTFLIPLKVINATGITQNSR